MPGFLIYIFILGSGIQEIKAKKALIKILLKIVPDLIEKEIKRILNKDISKKEVK
jgi:hypothetical protein